MKHGGVPPGTADEESRTSLSWAAGEGHWGVVKILLELGDVIQDTVDRGGRTPLSWAAAEGHEHVVNVLLGRED